MVKEKTRKALCFALVFLMLFSAFPSSAESPGPTAQGAAVHPPRVPPGAMALTRMPLAASFAAHRRVA